jgi:hypothetical protein
VLEVRRNVGKIAFSVSAVGCWMACSIMGCASGPNGIARLLPSQSVLTGWNVSGAPETYDGESLYDRIDGGAEIFFEYGFERALYQEYARNDDSLQIEIYDMTDDTAAFGIFSINKSPRAKDVPVGGGGQQYSDMVSFWQNDYYVVVRFFGRADAQGNVTLDVARDIERKIGTDRGTAPAVVSLLPTRDKVEGSDVVLRGNIALSQIYYVGDDEPFGLAPGTEAAGATYQVGDDSFRLLVVNYDSQGALDDAFERTAVLFGDRLKSAERSETRFTARDKTGKYVVAAKDGTVLTVVLGATSADAAGSLFSSTG